MLSRRPHAFSYRELTALSTEGAVRAALARGEIVRLLPDCYVAAEHSDSFAARADAALTWAGPRAYLGGASALHLWHAIDLPRSHIDVCVPHADRPRGPAWVKVRRLSYEVETRSVGRLRVAMPAFALVQGYGDIPRTARTEAVYRLIHDGVSVDDLDLALGSVPRVRERRELTRHIDAALQGAESWLEEESLFTVFNTREFGRFMRQHVIRSAHGRYRLDMYDPVTRTAVELDGAAWHGAPDQRARDLQRDADLAAMGIQTVRLTYRDIVERPQWCRQVVREVLTRRSQR